MGLFFFRIAAFAKKAISKNGGKTKYITIQVNDFVKRLLVFKLEQ